MILPISSLPLSSRHRVSQICFHPTQPYLAVQSHDRSVEIFRIRTEEEVQKKQLRRKKRAKKKQQEQTKGKERKVELEPENEDQDLDEGLNVKLIDLFTPYLVVRASGKIRSFDFGPGDTSAKGGTQVLCFFKSNYIILNSPPAVYGLGIKCFGSIQCPSAEKIQGRPRGYSHIFCRSSWA